MPSNDANAPKVVAPKIAVIGRTNVGKSTLFNRLVGKRQAIVEAAPGTTRDLVYGSFEWAGKSFNIVDSGGLAAGDSQDPEITKAIERSGQRLLKDADVVLLVCDGKSGILGPDEDLANTLRKEPIPTIVVINKIDTESQFQNAIGDFYRLGFKNVVPLSAAHGLGIRELCEKIALSLPDKLTEKQAEKADFSLAIVGEPNVGKSTYLNAVLSAERATVSSIPGTTRDPVEDLLEIEGKRIKLVDTAGARRHRKVNESVAFYSQRRTLDVISKADVVLLLFSAAEGLTRNSLMLVEQISEQNKSCVLVANKWDLTKSTEQENFRKTLFQRFKFLRHCPLIFMSAKNKRDITAPLKEAIRIWEVGKKRIDDRELVEVLSVFQNRVVAPGSPAKIKFATQVSVSPPHFVLFSNTSARISDTYMQAIRNELSERFKLGGIFFKLTVRRGKKKT